MVIECLGVPSCGKSYWMAKQKDAVCFSYLHNCGRIQRNIRKIRLVLYAFWTRPHRMIFYHRLFQRLNFDSYFKKVKMWLYLFSTLGGRYWLIKHHPDERIIMDEGINQVIWALLYNVKRDTNSFVYDLHHALVQEMGDQILVFHVDKEVLLSRLKHRNRPGGSELEHDVHSNPACLNRAIQYIVHIEMELKHLGYFPKELDGMIRYENLFYNQ